jgi:uncharacterized protein (TIGR00730 family)
VNRICVFCGSSPGRQAVHAEATRNLGAMLAREGLGLVYGGARVGLMGLLADAALAAGGEVIGVLPLALQERELAHPGLTRLHVVASMHERKALMADLADGFIALPGGFGTLDEFCEILTWAQLGIHAKPCGMLNVAGYFDPFLAQVEAAVTAGFMRENHRDLILCDTDPAALLGRMRQFKPQPRTKRVPPDTR